MRDKDIKTSCAEEFYTQEESEIIREKISKLKPKAIAFYITVIITCLLSFAVTVLRSFSFFNLLIIEYLSLGLTAVSLIFLIIFSTKYFIALNKLKKELKRFE